MGKVIRFDPRRRKSRKWTSAADYGGGGKPPRKPRKNGGGGGALREWLPLLVVVALVSGWVVARDALDTPPPTSEVDIEFGLCGEGSQAACVIDGDTVAVGQRRIRLTGYDAPELDGACEAESVAAQKARTALHTWLAKGRFSWTGGEDPARDQYGRELREAMRGEERLAQAMIDAGLAEGEGWGEGRDWC